MNIFCLSRDPREAARFMYDAHVRKMTLEAAQMLCTCSWLLGRSAPYKPTHGGHPCTKWVRQTRDNWLWLVHHALALGDECELRFGKRVKAEHVVRWIKRHGARPVRGSLTQHPLAFRKEYEGPRVPENPVFSYRCYYAQDKEHLFGYSPPRAKPAWFDHHR